MGATTRTTTSAANTALVLLLLLLLIMIFSSSSSSNYYYYSAQGRTIAISHTTALTNTIPIQIGTPVQSLSVGFDTSSDVALLPCETLSSATPVDCQSDLCKLIPNHGCKADGTCYFSTTYGDSAVRVTKAGQGLLRGDLIKQFTFGCVIGSDGTSFPRKQGLLGLGRGNLSLLHQSDSKYKSTFSFCLPNMSITPSTGSLTLGPADGQDAGNSHNAPLLQSLWRPSLYFVQLQTIWVDGTLILDLRKYSTPATPGTVIDSGLAFTSLVSWVYGALATAVHKKMTGIPLVTVPHFDTCYYNSSLRLNSITLKFRFFDLRLTKQQFVYKPNPTTECLAFRSAPNNVNHNLNIIGSYHLQHKRVLINEHLKFLRIADATTTTTC